MAHLAALARTAAALTSRAICAQVAVLVIVRVIMVVSRGLADREEVVVRVAPAGLEGRVDMRLSQRVAPGELMGTT